MSRRTQLEALRKAILDALGDSSDISAILRSLGSLSTGEIRGLKNQLKNTDDIIKVLQKYRSIAKFLGSFRTGTVRYGSSYVPPESRTPNVTLQAYRSFYSNQKTSAISNIGNRILQNMRSPYPTSVESIRSINTPSSNIYIPDPSDRSEEMQRLSSYFASGQSIFAQQGRTSMDMINRANRRIEETRQRLADDRYRKGVSNADARFRYSDFVRQRIDPERYRLANLAKSFYEDPVPSLGERNFDYERKRHEARNLAMQKARNALKIEKDNTDETSKNTSALMKLRSWLGPYAKMYFPFYAAKATLGTAKELGDDWIDRTPRVLNREMFERLYVPEEYKEQFDIFSGHFTRGGGSIESAMAQWKKIFQFAMDLKIGKGKDRLASIATALGVSPGNAETGNPGAMAMWMLRSIHSANPDQRALAMSLLGEDLVNAGILFGERFTRTQAMHNVKRRAEFEKKTAPSKLSSRYLGYWLDEGIFNNPRMANLLLQYQNMSPEERKKALSPYSPKWYDYFSKLADNSFGSGDPYIGIKEVVEKYPEAIRAIEAGATFNINVNQNVYPQTAGDIPKDSAREAGKEIGREIVETTSNAGN